MILFAFAIAVRYRYFYVIVVLILIFMYLCILYYFIYIDHSKEIAVISLFRSFAFRLFDRYMVSSISSSK